nr:hypothetical protein [uncultured Anaerostipes sp.]
MPSLIRVDKTTGKIDLRPDYKAKIDEMTEKMQELCELLSANSDQFNEIEAFDFIVQYIKDYDRILYSQISSVIYALFDEHETNEAMKALGTMTSNIEKIIAYTDTKNYRDKIEEEEKKGKEKKKAYEDASKALIKIWDHVNLAHTQYSGLKQTDKEYKRKFNTSIAPFKEELVRDMNAQLLTMVSIFTALAFLVFGGISSLGNIFSNHEIPLLKVIIVGCVWGLCILNLVFVFLFCVGKMTGLNFKSNLRSSANIIQKYPVVWWSNFIILTILIGSLWTHFIRIHNIDYNFKLWCINSPRLAMFGGYALIAVAFSFILYRLIKTTWKQEE